MPSHAITETGIVRLLDFGDVVVNSGMPLFLWTAGPDPVRSSVFTDFTEASFPGYARQVLPATAGSYNPVNDDAEADYGLFTWTLTADLPGPLVILGFGALDPFTGLLVFATNEPSAGWPQTIQHNGDQVATRFHTFAVPI